ncbi:MAG TPA: RNA methyltransferase [Acidimicrobiia bacterium]|nr:RNA methyltransferase [Acidimicrobiia bacterium]
MALGGFGDRVEGFHAVAAAVTAGRVEELWVATERRHRPEIAALVDRAERQGVIVRLVDDLAERSETEAPQGLVARARPLPVRTLEDLLAMAAVPGLMVLDHVLDPQNVGAIARSVGAAGLSGLVVPARRAAPLSAVVLKAAAGALETLPVAIVNSIADGLLRLAKAGLWLVGLEATATTPLFGLELLAQPVALVVGAEGSGLSRLVGERCDVMASIPLAPGAESLNVSVAAALAAFEVVRVRTAISLPTEG